MMDSQHQHGAERKLSLWEKTKGLFVVKKTDEDTVKVLTARDVEIKELEDELALCEQYIDQAIATNDPDFYPSIDMGRLHTLRDEVEQARQAEQGFWQSKLGQRLLTLFPILLMLVPEDQRAKIREFRENALAGVYQDDFQTQVERLTQEAEKQGEEESGPLLKLLEQQREAQLKTHATLQASL